MRGGEAQRVAVVALGVGKLVGDVRLNGKAEPLVGGVRAGRWEDYIGLNGRFSFLPLGQRAAQG